MKIQKKYFVGKNKPGVWASVYAYKPNSDDIFQKRGEIFAAVLLEGPKDFESSIAGNLLLDLLHETYFESEKESVLEALEDAVRAVKNRLINLVENDDSAAISGINFDLVTLVVKDKFFYSVRIGDGVLKVYRSGNLQDVSAGFKDPTGEKNYEVLSSFTKSGDVFFLSTPPTLDNFSHDELLESVSEYSEIGLKNKMVEDESSVGVLLIGVDLKHKEFDTSVQQSIEQNINLEDEQQIAVGFEDGQDVSFSDKRDQVGNVFDKLKVGAGSVLSKFRELFVSASQRFRKNAQMSKSNDFESMGSEDDQDLEDKPQTIGKDEKTYVAVLQTVWVRILKILKEIYLFVKVDLLAIEDKGIFLKGRQKTLNYRVLAALVVVLVVLLYGAISLRQSTINQARIDRENRELIEEIEEKLAEISGSSVFTIDTPDNISARENVLREMGLLRERIDSTEIADEYETNIEDAIAQLDSLELDLYRVIETKEPKLLSDLGALYEGAGPSDISVVGERIFVSDASRNVIYEINNTGGEKEFFTEGLDSPKFISADPEGDLIVLDEANTALGLLDLDQKELNRFVGMDSGKFADVIEMDAYQVADNDYRLYLAFSSSPQVQQINKVGSAYSSGPKSRWDDEALSGLVDIALIDGKFVFLKEGEGLTRYFVNSKITTTVTGLLGEDSISSANALATDKLYIYVGDSANNRVLVFGKSRGDNVDFVDLVAQYRDTSSSKFSDIKDISVGEDNIYVLDGARVYSLPKSDFQPFVY